MTFLQGKNNLQLRLTII